MSFFFPSYSTPSYYADERPAYGGAYRTPFGARRSYDPYEAAERQRRYELQQERQRQAEAERQLYEEELQRQAYLEAQRRRKIEAQERRAYENRLRQMEARRQMEEEALRQQMEEEERIRMEQYFPQRRRQRPQARPQQRAANPFFATAQPQQTKKAAPVHQQQAPPAARPATASASAAPKSSPKSPAAPAAPQVVHIKSAHSNITRIIRPELGRTIPIEFISASKPVAPLSDLLTESDSETAAKKERLLHHNEEEEPIDEEIEIESTHASDEDSDSGDMKHSDMMTSSTCSFDEDFHHDHEHDHDDLHDEPVAIASGSSSLASSKDDFVKLDSIGQELPKTAWADKKNEEIPAPVAAKADSDKAAEEATAKTMEATEAAKPTTAPADDDDDATESTPVAAPVPVTLTYETGTTRDHYSYAIRVGHLQKADLALNVLFAERRLRVAANGAANTIDIELPQDADLDERIGAKFNAAESGDGGNTLDIKIQRLPQHPRNAVSIQIQ